MKDPYLTATGDVDLKAIFRIARQSAEDELEICRQLQRDGKRVGVPSFDEAYQGALNRVMSNARVAAECERLRRGREKLSDRERELLRLRFELEKATNGLGKPLDHVRIATLKMAIADLERDQN